LLIGGNELVEIRSLLRFQFGLLLERLLRRGFETGLRGSAQWLAAEELGVCPGLAQSELAEALAVALELVEQLCRGCQAAVGDLGPLHVQRLRMRVFALALIQQ